MPIQFSMCHGCPGHSAPPETKSYMFLADGWIHSRNTEVELDSTSCRLPVWASVNGPIKSDHHPDSHQIKSDWGWYVLANCFHCWFLTVLIPECCWISIRAESKQQATRPIVVGTKSYPSWPSWNAGTWPWQFKTLQLSAPDTISMCNWIGCEPSLRLRCQLLPCTGSRWSTRRPHCTLGWSCSRQVFCRHLASRLAGKRMIMVMMIMTVMTIYDNDRVELGRGTWPWATTATQKDGDGQQIVDPTVRRHHLMFFCLTKFELHLPENMKLSKLSYYYIIWCIVLCFFIVSLSQCLNLKLYFFWG